MSAKRTKSSGADKKDQKPPADTSEDSTTTSTTPEIIDAVVEPVADPETTEVVTEEAPTVEQAAGGETTEPPTSESDDLLVLGDDVEIVDESIERIGENTVETAEDDSEELSETTEDIGDETLTDDETPADEVDAETVVETETEPAPEPQERVVERVVETRSVFVPAIFGGLVAGVVGFAAASTEQVSGLLSGGAEPATVAAATAEEVAALRDQIAELETRLAETPEAPESPDLSGIEAQIADGLAQQADAFAAADATLSARLDAFAAQLAELAQAPVEASISEEAIAAYEAELAAVQEALAQQRSEVEAMIADAAQMEAEATESARLAQAQAAATRLFASLETGGAFSAEVTELQSLGVTVPDALIAAAGGLTPLGVLQSDFPDLARTALAAARDETAGSTGFSGFLQRQLGARSVAPRDGDDPDAVLSRAEAALTQGDLTGALSELDGLPDIAKAPLSGWSDAATARQAALDAADDLAQSLASN